jgi:DNA-binding NarL/FixJ family response regulator
LKTPPQIGVVLGGFDGATSAKLTSIFARTGDIRVMTVCEQRCPAKLSAQSRDCVALVDEALANILLADLPRDHSSHVIVLAHKPSRPYGLVLLGLGITCIASSASNEALLRAVRQSAAGQRVFLRGDKQIVDDGEIERLTPRELAVAREFSKDRSYAQIALALSITPNTVRAHASGVRRKLGVRRREELIGLPIPDVAT